ncbi:MAG: hypothetical protein QXH37_08915 [Candidatus Bathyarchaeia archaeon]
MKKTIVIVILFFFLLQVFIYRSILFQESISHYADWYFPVTKDGVIKRASYFYTWDDWSYEGTNRVLKLPGTPFWIPLGLLSYMGIEPWILFRLCLIVIGVLASVGIFLLCKRFGLNSFGCVMGSLFYVFSPWFFAYAVWGWVYILVGYALLPFAFLFYLKALETQNMVYAICTSILSAGIGLQTHNLAIVFLLFLFYAIFDSLISANRKIFGNLKMLVLVAVLVLL